MKENGVGYHWRFETKEEDMQSGVRVIDGLKPKKRTLDEEKLARLPLPVRGREGRTRLAKLLGCLRLKRTHRYVCSGQRLDQY